MRAMPSAKPCLASGATGSAPMVDGLHRLAQGAGADAGDLLAVEPAAQQSLQSQLRLPEDSRDVIPQFMLLRVMLARSS